MFRLLREFSSGDSVDGTGSQLGLRFSAGGMARPELPAGRSPRESKPSFGHSAVNELRKWPALNKLISPGLGGVACFRDCRKSTGHGSRQSSFPSNRGTGFLAVFGRMRALDSRRPLSPASTGCASA